MKRYPGVVPIHQEIYNKRQSRARMGVEGMYGRLKGRWRCLLTPMGFPEMRNVCNIVVACVCLHNLLEERRVIYYKGYFEDAEYERLMSLYHLTSATVRARNGRPSRSAKAKRDVLCNFVNNEISDAECIRLLNLTSDYATLLHS